jgi:hypothetical protein
MNKKNILYWFIGWAGLFVAVLYSPMGSPDLYTGSSAYVVTQNVSFDNVVFSKKGSVSSGMPDNSPQIMSAGALTSTQGAVAQPMQSTMRGYGSGATTNSNSNESSRPSVGTSSLGMSSGGAAKSAANSGNIAESRSSSVVINAELNDPMVRQSATNDGSGILQPADDTDNNPGQMIPIGDNLGILMMMLGIYVVLRFRRIIRI